MKKNKKYLKKEDFISSLFYIDSFNLNRLFCNNCFKRMKIVSVRVGKIIMDYPGCAVTLSKSPVYEYLDGTTLSKERYKLYCMKYGSMNSNRTIDNYNKLISKFDKCGYDIQKGIIVVNQMNVLMDGQHRACLLLKKYGKSHKIRVLRVYDKRCNIVYRFRVLRDILFKNKISNI